MSAGTVFKVAAQNIYATVLDTNDLSTIRGSSLTLLEMPQGVLSVLEGFADLDVIPVQIAASELVVVVQGQGAAISRERRTLGNFKGIAKKKWRAALQPHVKLIKARTEAVTDDLLMQHAGQACDQLGLDGDSTGEVAGFLVGMLGNIAGARALSDARAQELSDAVLAYLSIEQDGWPFDLFHFATAWSPLTKKPDFAGALAKVDFELRRTQMELLDCPSPEPGNATASPVCELTNTLAASKHSKGTKPISESVHRRREAGRRGKQAFYGRVFSDALLKADLGIGEKARLEHAQDVLKALQGDGFAEDFDGIVAGAPDRLSLSARTNFAVLHMDGNSFGTLRAGIIDRHGVEGARAFSDWLEARKAQLLARILIWLDSNDISHDGRLCFETLLWGGDEFCFVLPSWEALPLLCEIQAEIAGWNYDGTELTFACGLAIAKHKAPIRPVRDAAERLVDLVKQDSRDTSLVQYCVYEGVDTLAMTPDAFRAGLYGAACAELEMSVALDQVRAIAREKAALEQDFHRAGLHRIFAQAAAHNSLPDDGAIIDHQKRLGDGGDLEMPSLLRSGSRSLSLAHLLQLWDHIPEVPTEGAAP